MALTVDPGTEAELPDVAPPEDAAVGAEPSPPGAPADLPADDTPRDAPALRTAVSVSFPVIAAAVMVGGVFLGASPRVYAVIAGLLGVALGAVASRLRSPLRTNLAVLAGLFAVGLVLVLPSGFGNVTGLKGLVSQAAASGDVLRPPVPWTPGWIAIVGWLMALVGFVTAWVAIPLRRAALALLLPLPVAAIAGISVPKSAQIASGLAVLVLFAVGLGLLSSSQSLGEGDERPPLSYELRKALKSLPLIAAITVALALLSQASFLFPKPAIDPTQQAQRPKTVPLSQVQDRVLFTVESSISGPWRTGSLDVYDGKDWRLPPFAESSLKDVPTSGIVDKELQPGVKATFTIAGLGGAVLPTVPNTVGIVAEGPRLAYDSRNGNIRTAAGQVQAGLKYTVTAAALPSVDDLRKITAALPADATKFAQIPISPPPAAADLIAKAPKTSKWDEFDYLRSYVLDNVVASGPGMPKSIDAARIQDMLAGSKEGSPFEIVAAEAMFARWIGVPSRIGYGFDGGEQIGNQLEIRPRNGATFVEVYFPGYKWLPVIGTPKQAKPTVGGESSQQQFDPTVQPSDDVNVQLYLPIVTPPGSVLFAQIRQVVLVALPVILLLVLGYVLWPAIRKSRLRGRRRAAARAAGPRARIALAYAELRDTATDHGFSHATDTPLMFLDRFIPDAEHTELAWLVTRTLWGDLQHDVTDDLAIAAEELSRSLRRRLAQTQPVTLRAIALVSRLSLRHPYAPDTDLTARRPDRAAA
ncbi:MAG TPA: transglutaminaseTgpA domain-containing protein [Acidimicrobiales bacterium]|nr:transglutaminaseTgpA domain-containing protein [Acidimicrobiales bacterium]